jgi:hypothetical protein
MTREKNPDWIRGKMKDNLDNSNSPAIGKLK